MKNKKISPFWCVFLGVVIFFAVLIIAYLIITKYTFKITRYDFDSPKVENEINRLFPQARTLRMDKDTTMKKGAHGDILSRFMNLQCWKSNF